MVITGGYWTKRKVTHYSEDGLSKKLPELKTGRRSHGCSSYADQNNIVMTIMNKFNCPGTVWTVINRAKEIMGVLGV